MAAGCLPGIGEFPYGATYSQRLADRSQWNLAAQFRGYALQLPGWPEFGDGGSGGWAADQAAICARVLTPSLSMMCCTWFSAVRAEITSAAAIWPFDSRARPETGSAKPTRSPN